MSNKLPLVLWSGGLDSTFVVWKNIADKQPIDVLYIDILNNQHKVEREHSAIESLKTLFDQYDTKIRKEYTITIPLIDKTSLVNAQAFFWMFGATCVFDKELHSHVELGYVRNDAFWHYKHEIETAYKSCSDAFTNTKKIKLQYPLEWHTKEDLYALYLSSSFGKKLLKKVTWCENESTKHARTRSCSCAPCVRMRRVITNANVEIVSHEEKKKHVRKH